MNVIVLTIGAIILACCALWAVLAQTLVPDVCTLETPPANAGPIQCEQ